MPFVCFMGPPNMRRLLSLLVLYETVELWRTLSVFLQKMLLLLTINCKEVQWWSLFWYFYECRSHCCLTMQAASFSAPPRYKRHSSLTNLAHEAPTGRSSAWVCLVTQSWSPFISWESAALSQAAKLFLFPFSPRMTSWIDGYSLDKQPTRR